MRFHFLHIHVQDTVIILEEVNLTHPWCLILEPCKVLNGRHATTSQCDKGVKRKRRRLAAEEIRESAARAFQYYAKPLETVTYFKYLGCILMASDDY